MNPPLNASRRRKGGEKAWEGNMYPRGLEFQVREP